MDDDQLRHFLHNVLGLSEEDVARRHSDRLAFLKLLCSAYDCHVPFQNLSMTMVPFKERQSPSLHDSIGDVVRRHGGLCLTLNAAMFTVLEKLGFDVIPILGSVFADGRNDHIMLVVRNVEREGDVFMIDVGFGRTAHPPIPLDFDEQSPVYKVSFSTLRFVKRGDMFIRQNRIHPKIGARYPETDGDWENVIYFRTEARKLEEIEVSIRENMYDVPTSTFNITRRITGMNKDLGKFVAIVNMKLLVEDDNGELQKTVLKDDEAVVSAVAKYFPCFPSDVVRRSYKIWHQYDHESMKKETFI